MERLVINIDRLTGSLQNSFREKKRIEIESICKGCSYSFVFLFPNPSEIEQLVFIINKNVRTQEWEDNRAGFLYRNLNMGALSYDVSVFFLGVKINQSTVASSGYFRTSTKISKKESFKEIWYQLLYFISYLINCLLIPYTRVEVKLLSNPEDILKIHCPETIVSSILLGTLKIGSKDILKTTSENQWRDLKHHLGAVQVNDDIYDLPLMKSEIIPIPSKFFGKPLNAIFMGIGLIMFFPFFLLSLLYNTFRLGINKYKSVSKKDNIK